MGLRAELGTDRSRIMFLITTRRFRETKRSKSGPTNQEHQQISNTIECLRDCAETSDGMANRGPRGIVMRILPFILLLAGGSSLLAQSSSTYKITHTYT